MSLSLKMFEQFICALFLFLFVASLGCAQVQAPWRGKKKSIKTIQIFATGDDPTGWISVDDGRTFRKREVIFNPVLLNEIDTINTGDKLVGELFDGTYFEATVSRVHDGFQAKILAYIDSDGGLVEIFIMREIITLRIYFDKAEKSYICDFDKSEGNHVIKEIESGWAKEARRKRAVAAAKTAGPKTVQIFTEDDDPANRITWKKTTASSKSFKRMRKASINPQLFADRIDEILIGDTFVGQLFEDEYFKAVVIKQLKGDLFPGLMLEITGDNNIANWVSLHSHENSIYLSIEDKTRGKEFLISSNERTSYHVVTEIDPTKRPKMLYGDSVPIPSEDKKDK